MVLLHIEDQVEHRDKQVVDLRLHIEDQVEHLGKKVVVLRSMVHILVVELHIGREEVGQVEQCGKWVGLQLHIVQVVHLGKKVVVLRFVQLQVLEDHLGK